ncbi:MAG TPA: MarR family transcriptional regulator [Pseudonocardiaceae bacterium]|nr:MarR family transcriptional regulator [Pseudonocardiaceae bacterium]
MATDPGTPVSPATDPAGAASLNLVIAIHQLRRGLRAVLPPGQFNPTQVLILTQLAGSDPMRVGELAQRVHVSQPTATTVVNGLAAAGLVSRIKDTEDGRAIKVSLTELGMQNLHEVGRQEAAYLRTLIDALPADERATILAAIPIMMRLADASRSAEYNQLSGIAARADIWGRSTKTGS